MVWNPDKEITSIKLILKRYLRKFNFKITVKYINYPEINMKEIVREYRIKPKEIHSK
jgi:hypothetical protein